MRFNQSIGWTLDSPLVSQALQQASHQGCLARPQVALQANNVPNFQSFS